MRSGVKFNDFKININLNKEKLSENDRFTFFYYILSISVILEA